MFENSCNSLLSKFRVWTNLEFLSLCEYLQEKFHHTLASVRLPTANIFLNQSKTFEANVEMILNRTISRKLFIRRKKFQTNRPFEILNTRDKYYSEVMVKNKPRYSTKI